MKIYLATAWNDHDTIRRAIGEIERHGHDLHARWTELALGGKEYGDGSEANLPNANMDLSDLHSSDGVLLVPNREMGTGHHIEFGYALAIGKPTVIVGETWTIFHALVPQTDDYGRALELLERKMKERLAVW